MRRSPVVLVRLIDGGSNLGGFSVVVVNCLIGVRPLAAPQEIRVGCLGGDVTLQFMIREANEDDAEAVSRVILAALRQSNSKD